MEAKKFIIYTLLIIINFIFIHPKPTIYANCRGCCSHHGGVVCNNGITICGDGSSLSYKCQSKGCNKCFNNNIQELDNYDQKEFDNYDQKEFDNYDQKIKINDKPYYNKSSSGIKECICNGKVTYTNLPCDHCYKEYNRKNWPHWIDEDNDCQNTRTEILIRDNIGKLKFKRNKRCNVSWGQWLCPYTDNTYFKASDIDIDHIVPLKHAYETGGANWDRKKKRKFANDMENLLAVADYINQEKGSKSPVEWLPPNKSYWKKYAEKWLYIKNKYKLYISNEEFKILSSIP